MANVGPARICKLLRLHDVRLPRCGNGRLVLGMKMMTRFLQTGVAIFIAALVVVGCAKSGTDLSDRLPIKDFVLQSAAGPVDSKALRGNVLLVYFGYVSCPDVCPASLAADAAALNLLNEKERAKTKLIFISVDPERDTPEIAKAYAELFHPQSIGAVGSDAEVAAIAKSFGASFVREPKRPDGGYVVNHTTHTHVVAPNGKLAPVLPIGTPPYKVAAAVRALL